MSAMEEEVEGALLALVVVVCQEKEGREREGDTIPALAMPTERASWKGKGKSIIILTRPISTSRGALFFPLHTKSFFPASLFPVLPYYPPSPPSAHSSISPPFWALPPSPAAFSTCCAHIASDPSIFNTFSHPSIPHHGTARGGSVSNSVSGAWIDGTRLAKL